MILLYFHVVLKYQRIVLFVFLISCAGCLHLSAQDFRDEPNQISFTKTYDTTYFTVYSKLFKTENLELIGKLLTVFLHEEEKGYKFSHINGNVFAVESSTIQPESFLVCEKMDRSGFILSGNLILKKIFTFESQVLVETEYSLKGDFLYSKTSIKYTAPGIVDGINRVLRFFSGSDFVRKKITEFVERLDIVIEGLKNISAEEWKRLSNDDKFLSNLMFPVSFTENERSMVSNIVRTVQND